MSTASRNSYFEFFKMSGFTRTCVQGSYDTYVALFWRFHSVGQEMEYIDKRYRFEDTGLQITLQVVFLMGIRTRLLQRRYVRRGRSYFRRNFCLHSMHWTEDMKTQSRQPLAVKWFGMCRQGVNTTVNN
jgi:hypothetical protein